jgi:hypothetical protein|tara:strand:- start:733 stop:930 length:198 start_codon:yes stop_codon:yes gene_type:complete
MYNVVHASRVIVILLLFGIESSMKTISNDQLRIEAGIEGLTHRKVAKSAEKVFDYTFKVGYLYCI